MELGKACEDLSWNRCTSTTKIRDKWDFWKSSVQNKGKHLCCIVVIRSGCKLVGKFYGMLHLSAKHHRFIIWWEDAPWKTFWATIDRTDCSIWFIGEVSPNDCEGPVTLPSIWKESLTWIVPRIRFVRGVNLEGWRTGCRPWGVRDDGRIGNLLEKTQCESSDASQRKRRIYFSNRRWTNQNLWRRSGPESVHPDTAATNSWRKSSYFLGKSERSLPPPHDSLPDINEAIHDFWSMSRIFTCRHHVEPRVKLYSSREESFPTPLKYIDVTRTTHTNFDVMPERRIDDYWNIDGSRRLSDSWTSFTQFTPLYETPPNG